MQKDIDIRVSPKEASEKESIRRIYAGETKIPLQNIHSVRILRRSIDARQRNIFVNLRVRGYIDEEQVEPEFTSIHYPIVTDCQSVIVVGAGPAGLFSALRLIELGKKPIIIERGKNVHDRKKDTALLNRDHVVNPESNYCFGEGGAGAYSDGKLYTRSKKRGNVDKILNIFCQHGADPSILIDAHPHIGTDKLPVIISKMRDTILASGGEVHFETRMDKLIIQNGEVKGIETNTGKTFMGPVILATGHSARDVYYMLDRQNIRLEAKGFAVGFRIEHPAKLIDSIQYHSPQGRGDYLPAAEYSFVVQSGGRGVYSFCMCPGGIIVPSASAPKQVVVNGMSPSNRGSRWSNSGVVVEVRPEDFPDYAKFGELCLLKFQEDLEEKAWHHGGQSQVAPAQLMDDFVRSKKSTSLLPTSYIPGVVSSSIQEWMPQFVVSRLQDAFLQLDRKMKGYLTNEAMLLGVESRTSSPVRIVRDSETMQHPDVKGLFPCGEGAGYAGGIVSAAMDGERCAEAVIRTFEQSSKGISK